jgi:MoxR-like ATPase
MSHKEKFERFRAQLEEQVMGQSEAVELTLIALLAGGHVLLEGPPGVGKTALAHGVAALFHGTFRRVQLTSDLLPSDIVGTLRLQPGTGEFEFRRGPIFSQVLLADELNRTSPKTQAALLEAMAENRVTVDGVTYPLPEPFFVIATQNPQEFQGVFPLSESQLDRFLIHVSMGLPAADMELKLYQRYAAKGKGENKDISLLQPAELLALRQEAGKVFVEDSLLKYVQNIAAAVRSTEDVLYGASVRSVLQWIDAAKARAFLQGRNFVSPEDIKVLAPAVLGHRLFTRGVDLAFRLRKEIVSDALAAVAAPQ